MCVLLCGVCKLVRFGYFSLTTRGFAQNIECVTV